MISYRVIKGENSHFGIEAHEYGSVLERVEDLFDNRLEAVKFADLCNRLELSPMHLQDVAKDIIYMKNRGDTGF